MLALDWAEDKAPSELQKFDFIFLIALRNIDRDIPLEEVVIKQHGRFKARKVPKEHIKYILDGSIKAKYYYCWMGMMSTQKVQMWKLMKP